MQFRAKPNETVHEHFVHHGCSPPALFTIGGSECFVHHFDYFVHHFDILFTTGNWPAMFTIGFVHHRLCSPPTMFTIGFVHQITTGFVHHRLCSPSPIGFVHHCRGEGEAAQAAESDCRSCAGSRSCTEAEQAAGAAEAV